MKTRRLGTSGMEVSEVGLGCMSLPEELPEAQSIVDEALASGIRLFDTADLYGKGTNEELVGAALKNRRKDIILATKVGNEWSRDSDEVKWNATKPYITAQVHESLRRLGTDYIDLYQLHGGMITDGIDETIDAFERLKQDGLIREYGISSIRPNVIRRYLADSSIASIMMQYSLLDRRPEEWLGPIGDAGVSVITRGTLAQGLLTDHGLERAAEKDGYMGYGDEELRDVLAALSGIHDSPHALALHSVLDDPRIASVITGASSPGQLRETIRAYDTDVTEQQIREAKRLTKQERYTAHRE